MTKKSSILLVLGGSRSGKSRRAEELALGAKKPVTYVATCLTRNLDEEMIRRIRRHRSDRPRSWKTVEDCLNLEKIVGSCRGRLVLVDCLTLWVSGRMMQKKGEAAIVAEIRKTLQKARPLGVELILVSNEVGGGVIPSSAEARAFRDACGRVNQTVAALADRVEWMVAGIPVLIKG